MIIISTSFTVPGQLPPRFHVEAWLPFRIGTVKWTIRRFYKLKKSVVSYIASHRR